MFLYTFILFSDIQRWDKFKTVWAKYNDHLYSMNAWLYLRNLPTYTVTFYYISLIMFNVFNILLVIHSSLLFTYYVNILDQYLGYYAKYSYFNLKVSKSKVSKARNLGLHILESLGFTGVILILLSWWAMKHINYKCMKIMVGHASDSMSTLAYNFYQWISA